MEGARQGKVNKLFKEGGVSGCFRKKEEGAKKGYGSTPHHD